MLPAHLKFNVFGPKRVHLGVTGSIAAYKALEVLRDLLQLDLSVSVSLTASASRFVTALSFASLGAEPVYDSLWAQGHESFGHLEPAQNSDCLVIAPATANILAKITHGLADDILSTQVLAFSGPIILAPAMNPRLYRAHATQDNISILKKRGLIVVEPGEGSLACGEEGKGRLADPPDIAAEVMKAIAPKDMAGCKVLVSLGPTREYFDPARFWSNPSTGFMGQALALAAWLRGAEVTVVHGPVAVSLPGSIERHGVTTAKEMFTCCLDLWPRYDMAFMTAAVADFSPVYWGQVKFKKTSLIDEELNLKFQPNPDILLNLGKSKKIDQILLGFCAETENILENAQDKLMRKNCDLIAANSITTPGSGFGSPTNAMLVCDKHGRVEQWPVLSKCEVAWRLCEWICHLLA